MLVQMEKDLSATLRVLMFTDVVGSVELKGKLGTPVYARLLARHDKLLKTIIVSTPKSQIRQDTGDGFLLEFATPSDAVNAALRFQYGLKTPDWEPRGLDVRLGIHLGTV